MFGLIIKILSRTVKRKHVTEQHKKAMCVLFTKLALVSLAKSQWHPLSSTSFFFFFVPNKLILYRYYTEQDISCLVTFGITAHLVIIFCCTPMVAGKFMLGSQSSHIPCDYSDFGLFY